MPVPAVTTSAAGSLSLLEDEDKQVRVYALQHLLAIVPQFWAEISDKLGYLELIADASSNELPATARPAAALLISKVYFYLGELEEAVEFALIAGTAFEKEPEGEFRETIISGCLDRAIKQTSTGEKPDPKLWGIVEGVLRSSAGENGKLAIGLALSLRRLDLIEMIFLTSRAPPSQSSSAPSRPTHDENLLRYVLNEIVSGTSGSEVLPTEFKSNVFSLLLRLFSLSPSPDYNAITTLWVQSDAPQPCAEALVKLLKEDKVLEAYQIGFDVAEVATQSFVEVVRSKLEDAGYGPDKTPTDENSFIETDSRDPRVVLNQILRGVRSAELFLNFLQTNNKTDMSILKTTRDSLEDRYSIYHEAITFTNAFAHCGTTSDKFLRENLDWLGRASNWAKFSTTAALGIIHRGSWINGMRVVRPYLPGGSAPSKFSEGGALFALGLIYSGRREGCEDELRRGIAEGNDPIVQHGAALGLGVSGIATGDEDIYEDLRTALFQDNATAGEAAGYAMGLVMLGSASEKALDEMLAYARETQHEKIIRSLSVGIALIMYGTQDRADGIIKELSEEKDSILRYGAMFTIALAYAGTGNNKAVRKLLHVAVSDVNDDVRRAAVTALGFVLFRNHTQVPRVVQLLAESYNPHVRHGATLALGISCAGTGLEAAVELLEPMTKDPVDFVRQGAYISLALILIQQSETQNSRVPAIRDLFSKVVADKHEDPMARFGASLAQGIIDAGGRNMTLSLSTRAGTLNMNAIVGMTLFVQFWYWYPLAHGLGLAFSPTAVIAVDKRLRVPHMEFTCHSKPSTFAYPQGAKKEVEKKEKKAKTAVLSTTAKARAREKSKKEEKGEAMDTDEKEEGKDANATSTTPSRVPTPANKRKEPSTFTFRNMTRVTPQQLPLISLTNDRYTPLRPIGQPNPKQEPKGSPNAILGAGPTIQRSSGSIVLLQDAQEEESGNYVELDKSLWPDLPPSLGPGVQVIDRSGQQPAPAGELEGGEAEAPPAFEYPFDD